MDEYKLDNPVWYALGEYHKEHCINLNETRFYQPHYCPFGALDASSDTSSGIDQYAQRINNFYIVGEQPKFSNNVKLVKELLCLQMILVEPAPIEINETIVALTTPAQKESLFELVNLVQPGYFRPRTSDLGDYYGIYKDEKLVAVTGERMKLDLFTEVSAVVTHPDRNGKGYAKQLMYHTSQKILNEHKKVFLHVAKSNTGAIKLYEKLGFLTRREISFWNFELSD